MKKFIMFLTSFLLLLAMTSPALADFTPSVTAKSAPEIVTQTNEAGEPILGTIVNEETGETYEIPVDGGLTITSYAEVDGASESVKTNLVAAYEKINDVSSLTELDPDVEDALLDMGADFSADDLVVRDLFDVTLSEEVDEVFSKGGFLTLTFDLGVAADEPVVIMTCCNNKDWKVVDPQYVTNNGDGTVTVNFPEMCPVLFAVKGTETPVKVTDTVTNGSKTADNSTESDGKATDSAVKGTVTNSINGENDTKGNIWVPIAIIVVSLAVVSAAVLIIVKSTKKEKATKEVVQNKSENKESVTNKSDKK